MTYDDEFRRIRQEYEYLPVRDDAGRKRLENELENVIRLALPPDVAERYVKQIGDVWFYPMAAFSGGPDMTPETWPEGRQQMVALIDGILHQIRLGGTQKPAARRQARDKVFIVHGHDERMLRGVEAFVRRIGLGAVVLMDEPSKNQTVIEKIETLGDVTFAIVLLSADDVGRVHTAPADVEKRRPRQNGVLELGYFMGRLGRENVCVVVDADLDAETEYPSDMAGVVRIPYRNGGDWQMRLVREFRASKLEFDERKA